MRFRRARSSFRRGRRSSFRGRRVVRRVFRRRGSAGRSLRIGHRM